MTGKHRAQNTPADGGHSCLRSSDIPALIDAWHADHFHGSAAGRDVEVWNLIHAAKEDLKLRLAAVIKES